ncbi:hypothetical protein Voc01_072420 [Virgisporangium ochraceum]|uniref:Lipoprotein n=1 Tax=Virgisporangium ochraceum TaxID=65505 RepID=A0A8J4EE82_9ACTN|nr:hypothetical protein Voc01_072420 [Virgisporangium ochraceum]
MAAILLTLTVAGCAGAAPTRTPGAPAPSGPGSGGPGSSAPAPAGADPVDVYAAAIARYLTGRENSFPGRTFPVVFVLDRLDAAAADPMTAVGTGPTSPLTPAQQQRIESVSGTDLTFVPSLDAATTGDSCRLVRDDGVFVALGPAAPTGTDTAQVAVHGFVACQGATWFTYVLRRDATGWTVTGTTGQMAVS